jgi:hypothetical protein
MASHLIGIVNQGNDTAPVEVRGEPGGGEFNLNGQVRSRGISRTGYDERSPHTGAARLAAGRQQTA